MFRIILLLWNLSSVTAVLLLRFQSTFKVIWWFQLPISQLRDLTGSCYTTFPQILKQAFWVSKTTKHHRHERKGKVWYETTGNTVETLYNTINFCWSTHKRHSIARPKGRGMGVSFVSSKGNILCRLINIELYKILAIINRAIKGLHCIVKPLI